MIPLFLSAFRRADELAMAMEARCYRGGQGRTRLRELRYKKTDFLAIACSFAFLAVTLLDRFWIRGFLGRGRDAGSCQRKNIMLTIAYDGTDFSGFQSQRGSGLATIQESLEKALSRLTGQPVTVEGSDVPMPGSCLGTGGKFQNCRQNPPIDGVLALRPYLPESITVRESGRYRQIFMPVFLPRKRRIVISFTAKG